MGSLKTKLSYLFSKKKIEFPAPKSEDASRPPLRHIGFIMDGNGRWASRQGLSREMGHRAGGKVARRVIEHCIDLDIEVVTVYIFSTENWKRPQHEVNAIMDLFLEYLHDGLEKDHDHNSHVHFLGDKSKLPEQTQKLMDDLHEKSSGYRHKLNIAVNYGGRSEIVHAVNTLIKDGKVTITEEDISSALYTSGQPDPDLIVRTGGETRISNFLLWQSAYSEFYFTDKLWPDITDEDVDDAVKYYYTKERRFGKVGMAK